MDLVRIFLCSIIISRKNEMNIAKTSGYYISIFPDTGLGETILFA